MTSSSQSKFRVYKDYNGDFKWELRNPRNEVIAESPNGFRQKKKCVSAVSQVKEVVSGTSTVEVE